MNTGERLILAQSRMDGAEERMDEARAAVNNAQEDVIAGSITYSNYKERCDYFYQMARALKHTRDAYWKAYDDYHNEELDAEEYMLDDDIQEAR